MKAFSVLALLAMTSVSFAQDEKIKEISNGRYIVTTSKNMKKSTASIASAQCLAGDELITGGCNSNSGAIVNLNASRMEVQGELSEKWLCSFNTDKESAEKYGDYIVLSAQAICKRK